VTKLAASGLVSLLLTGCPDSNPPAATPAPQGNSPPAKIDVPPPPPPPPPRPKEGWGAVNVGSSFETITKTHYENGLPDSERKTVQTVTGFDADGVRVQIVYSGEGVDDPPRDEKYTFKSMAKDPDAKKPETTKETLTVGGKSYECDVTTETTELGTKKTWATSALPVPVKIEVKGEGVLSVSELVKVDLK